MFGGFKGKEGGSYGPGSYKGLRTAQSTINYKKFVNVTRSGRDRLCRQQSV